MERRGGRERLNFGCHRPSSLGPLRVRDERAGRLLGTRVLGSVGPASAGSDRGQITSVAAHGLARYYSHSAAQGCLDLATGIRRPGAAGVGGGSSRRSHDQGRPRESPDWNELVCRAALRTRYASHYLQDRLALWFCTDVAESASTDRRTTPQAAISSADKKLRSDSASMAFRLSLIMIRSGMMELMSISTRVV